MTLYQYDPTRSPEGCFTSFIHVSPSISRGAESTILCRCKWKVGLEFLNTVSFCTPLASRPVFSVGTTPYMNDGAGMDPASSREAVCPGGEKGVGKRNNLLNCALKIVADLG